MNNEYFNKLSQSIKAYLRYVEKVEPVDLDGGFADSVYVDPLGIEGGFAPDIEREEIDGGIAKGFYGFVYIRSDTDLQEIEYNDNLDRIIGCFNARTAKVKIMNPISYGNYRYSLIDKDIELFMGYKDDSGVHYSKKGTFRVKKTDSETVGIQTEFELQDKSFIFDTVCTLEFPYPCTRLQVVQIICEHLGIELATLNFWLSDAILEKQFYNPGSTYREIIRIIAEASCCFAKIGDDDKLHIKFFEKSDYKLIPRVYKKLNIEDCFGYVNRIVLCEMDESGSTDYDVIIAEDEESIKNFGLTEVRISNNLILNEDREKYAPLLLSQLSTFRYYSFSTEMVLGNYLLDHCVIDLVDKDGSVKPSVIMNLNFRYNGALKTNISSPAPSKTKQQYPGAGKVGEQIKNVWLNVDKIKGVITSLNEEITDQGTRLTQIEQSSTEVKTIISQTGSDNLIRNSVGYAWETVDNQEVPKFWTLISGKVGYIENDFTRINTLSNRGWLFTTGCMEQEIAVTTNNVYTLSLIVKKLKAIGTASVIIENGRQKIVYDESMDDGSYNYSFIAQGNSIKIIIESEQTELLLSDLIINTGNSPQQWKQASGELYTSEVLVDIDGMLIKYNVYSGYTVISPSEFAGYYLVNGRMIRVFTLNKDTTEVNKLWAYESIEIGDTSEQNVKTMFIAGRDGLDIVIVDKEVA